MPWTSECLATQPCLAEEMQVQMMCLASTYQVRLMPGPEIHMACNSPCIPVFLQEPDLDAIHNLCPWCPQL